MKRILFFCFGSAMWLIVASFVLYACENRKTRAEIEAEFASFNDNDSDTLLNVENRRSERYEDLSAIRGKTIEQLQKEEEAAKQRKEEEERQREEALEQSEIETEVEAAESPEIPQVESGVQEEE